MWNKKRLDDLERRIKWLERENCVPIKTDIHNLDIYPNGKQYDKLFSISEALCIVIGYLHLTLHEEPAKTTITGILDREKSEDTNG